MAVIEVHSFGFTYPGAQRPAVRGVSFTVEAREIFGFLGPSGAGNIVQQRLGLGVGTVPAEHLDSVDGRYWMRLEWRALARALRESGEPRALAIREALAFRQACHARYPDKVETERALDINEGLASYVRAVFPAQSAAEAIASAVEELTADPF